MHAVHGRTGSSVFVVREDGRVTGLLGELPLTDSGLKAIEAGEFRGSAPKLEYVAEPGDLVFAYYCWGFATENRRAAAATVKGMIIARDEIYPDLPFFARAAKPAGAGEDAVSNGARVSFRRFDCTYYPGQPDLLFSPRSRSIRSPVA